MSNRRELERALGRVLEVLRDYMDDLVLVGGWVPYLHLSYGRPAVAAPRTSLTAEADLLVPIDLRRGRRRPIADILRQAGFEPRGVSGVLWAREPGQGGETIEFLCPMRGPAGRRGESRDLADQPGLRGLSLDHLHVMEEFTESVTLPPPARGTSLEVRVPTLGAFALNKANTFHLRGGADAREKAGKDLLYLRDIMAAGDRAIDVVDQDLATIAEASGPSSAGLRRATHHLRHVAPRYFGPAAEILAERDGVDHAAARGDVEGHLTDVAEVVAKHSGVGGEPPVA